jgi:predicted negative regulator of RcsB-dependent stress response
MTADLDLCLQADSMRAYWRARSVVLIVVVVLLGFAACTAWSAIVSFYN